MLIRISGHALVTSADGALMPEQIREMISGVKSSDSCVNYLDRDLAKLGLTGGHVELRFDSPNGSLRVVTEYESEVDLPQVTINRLAKRTQGQWTDGIGAECFSEVCEKYQVEIDICPLGEVDQVKIEVENLAGNNLSAGKRKAPKKNALSIAAREGDLEEVCHLLDNGADVNEIAQETTALCGAILAGHANVALELISRGADIHHKGEFGDDALMSAALSNKITDEDAARVAEELLNRGVSAIEPRDDCTPLSIALDREKFQLAKVLQSFGAEE